LLLPIEFSLQIVVIIWYRGDYWHSQ
jgi:hypothetical protein